MNDGEFENLLYRILSGHLIFYYKQEKYELRRVSNLVRYEGNLLYNKILNDEKYNDWIREENISGIMINLGLWTKETDKTIKQLEKKIENNKVELYENFMKTDTQKKIRKNLEASRDQLNRINSTRSEFTSHTLEGYAHSIKNEYIICQSLYKNSKKLFSDPDSDSSSYSSFNEMVFEVNKYNISISDFKKLSRNYIWKSYWNAHKNNPMFPGPVSEWTDDQRSLVSFSQMYDSIYEHPECPAEAVIDDDDALDGWMIVQKRKVEKAKKQQSIDEMNPNLKKAGEVFLFGQNSTEVEEIMSLNSPEALHKMKEKISFINKVGSVDDSSLPDVKRELISQAQSAAKNK
jgi:hypothetical protein